MARIPEAVSFTPEKTERWRPHQQRVHDISPHKGPTKLLDWHLSASSTGVAYLLQPSVVFRFTAQDDLEALRNKMNTNEPIFLSQILPCLA